MKKLLVIITALFIGGCEVHGHYDDPYYYSSPDYRCAGTDFDYLYTEFDCAHNSFVVTFCDPSGYYLSRGNCTYPEELRVRDHSCYVTNVCRGASEEIYFY